MAPHQNVTVRVAPTHTDAVDDGLGTPWMPQNFGGGTPFSSAQSDIQFASQADTTQGATPPNQPCTTSSSATMNSFLMRDTAQQEDILLTGLNDLKDDPQDIMLFQMDEAISNVGAASAIFDYDKKLIMKECWQQWGLTLWNALHEHLTDVTKVQRIISRCLERIRPY